MIAAPHHNRDQGVTYKSSGYEVRALATSTINRHMSLRPQLLHRSDHQLPPLLLPIDDGSGRRRRFGR
jgi:hypothetical protein